MIEPSQQYPFRLAPLQPSWLCVGLVYNRVSVHCTIAAEGRGADYKVDASGIREDALQGRDDEERRNKHGGQTLRR